MPASSRNRLQYEKSPYLLQHAGNPVEWYPWGPEAFAKAESEDKPILLSIGYSTCHWCHVMEHESFENPDIAGLMNQFFVNIKVDREERPDVDQIYMTAVQSMTGQGGWPLTVFLTPDKKPFYGGTYFPPYPKYNVPGFGQLLESIHHAWSTNREQVTHSGEELYRALASSAGTASDDDLSEAVLEKAYRQYSSSYDAAWGGFGQAPKFPMGHSLSFLWRYYHRSGEIRAREMVTDTLNRMAQGGLFDQLGGGFHRYATDRLWQVPHFEKMLYDQALLCMAYLEGFQITRDAAWADVTRRTLDYVIRELRDEQGGFYCAQDADSVPVEEAQSPDARKTEGAYYLWTYREIQNLLDEDAFAVTVYHFGLKPDGNAKSDPHQEFTGKNILFVEHSLQETAEHFSKSFEEVKGVIQRARSVLLEARVHHPRPHLDDKILTDWNGLMISAMSTAGDVLDEPRYTEAAAAAADFILDHLLDSKDRLLHRYRDGEAAITATLNDYAFFIGGLIDVYQATWETRYLREAVRLARVMLQAFGDPARGGFFMADEAATDLIVRPREIYDGAIPSGNAAAAYNLIRLSDMVHEDAFRESGYRALQAHQRTIEQYPSGYSYALTALAYWLGPSYQIVLAQGRNGEGQALRRALYAAFVPHKVAVFRPLEPERLEEAVCIIPFIHAQAPVNDCDSVYICQGHSCQRPVTQPEDLAALIADA